MNNWRQRTTIHPRSRLRRSIRALWRQARHTPVCPHQPRLDGQLALVTGGSGGIGLETGKGLARRGAEVIVAARNPSRARAAINQIQRLGGTAAHLALDLADLDRVTAAVDEIARRWPDRPLDLVIANAGIWPTQFSQSAQGYELAFAVNVLGHHVLLQRLFAAGRLAPQARVVVLTGDIYVLARDCTPDYIYRGLWGGQMAYCRSKLGNLWLARQMARRHPGLLVTCVHPGVVASGLGVQTRGLAHKVRQGVMISPRAGAQTSLICATQPDLVSGAYYHNTMGHVRLHPDDLAANDRRAAQFWDLLEKLASPFTP